jgi:hypothetical protein
MPITPSRREFAKAAIDASIRTAQDSCGRKSGRAFADLLCEVRRRSDLLRPGLYVGRAEVGCSDRIVGGLLALVGHRKGWLRPIRGWEPFGRTAVLVFSSLAHHLLAAYPAPPVLLSAWFRGTDGRARRLQGWFRHAATGGSLRTAGFPIGLTRRMAHEFAHAPDDLPIESALRWAQVRGLGGPDELARAVASTRLGRDFDHDEFWASAIRLFINAPGLDLAHVEPIVEYLHDQKFVPRAAIVGEGTEACPEPPRPDLSLKGRTAASVMRCAEEWREERRRKEARRRIIRWGPSGIRGYRLRIGDGRSWTIRELLDSDELSGEGKAMHHCVASYKGRCASGLTTIWSLGLEGPEGRERLVTIEVEPGSRRVVQVKAKCNEEPDGASRAILMDWAGREGLRVEG